MATYRNSLYRYCRLWSLFVASQIKNRFVESKHLYQRIKHHFCCVPFALTSSKSLERNGRNQVPFYRYNAYNLHRVAYDNGGWRRLSIVVATECCWLKKLSCRGSGTSEILQDSKNKRHRTWNIMFMLFKYDF